MNTEHLFGIYWAGQRLRPAAARTPRVPDARERRVVVDERARDSAREAANQRLFDAVRQAVLDSRNRL